jgi:hypothetical protein
MTGVTSLQVVSPVTAAGLSDAEATAFGRSLHANFYGVRRERCDDLAFCYGLLDELTAGLRLHKQAQPFLFRSPEDELPDKAGLSGWVPLMRLFAAARAKGLTGGPPAAWLDTLAQALWSAEVDITA